MPISKRDRVWRRAGHLTFSYDDRLFIWGGFVEHVPKTPRYPNTAPKNANDVHDTNTLFSYDPLEQSWLGYLTSGSVPPRSIGASGCRIGNHFYVFGGQCLYEDDLGSSDGNNNAVYELHLSSWKWRRLHPSSDVEPMKVEKSVAFTFNQSLYLFGGYGEYPRQPLGNDEFHLNHESSNLWPRGWFSSVFKFCTKTNCWMKITTKGESPPPRAGHAGTVIQDYFIVFGGRGMRGKRFSDTWMLNLKSHEWTKLFHEDHCSPEGRSLHSLTTIGSAEAMLYGGINSYCQPLNDGWIFNLQLKSWRSLDLPYDHGEIRCGHGASCTEHGLLMIHSGLTQEYYLNRIQLDDHVETILTFQFGPKRLFDLAFLFCVSYFDEKKLKAVILPEQIRMRLVARLNEVYIEHDCEPLDDLDYFSRSLIHTGV